MTRAAIRISHNYIQHQMFLVFTSLLHMIHVILILKFSLVSQHRKCRNTHLICKTGLKVLKDTRMNRVKTINHPGCFSKDNSIKVAIWKVMDGSLASCQVQGLNMVQMPICEEIGGEAWLKLDNINRN